jgi:gliding motility-associated-like protein
MKKILFLFYFTLLSLVGFSQGDDCSTALQLTNLSNFCSSNGAYTNATATVGGFGIPACWQSGTTSDVWFKFIATGTDVIFSVNGSGKSTGATLKNPEVALYTGDCASTISELACKSNYNASSYSNSNGVTVYKGSLVLGTTYLVRVSTTNANRGKFDICVNNFTPVPNPNDPNDCDRATIICNKDATSIGTLNGAGNNTNEVNLGCFATASSGESNSTWLTFTCKTTGTLDFDIVGADPTDDIDWLFLEIPGIRNCATKTVLSCNLSSCDVTGGNSSTAPHKTGIRPGENAPSLVNGSDVTANSEPGGCSSSPQNGYNNELTITAGKTYVLFLNNFIGSSGYTVSWGGTSTFVGPESKITVDKTSICVGENVTVNGSSSLAYTSFKWDLPTEAYPNTQTGIGPFTQTFNNTGTYPIVLTTYDNNGCLDVKNTLITVNGLNADFTAPSVCVGNPTTFTCTTAGISGATWNFGDSGTGSGSTTTHTYASPGTYKTTLTVNGNGCNNVISQDVSVLGATINITPNPASTCPGSPLTLNATASVNGNMSGSKILTQNSSVTVPSADYYSSIGVDDTWDGSIGSGANSALTTDVGVSNLSVTGLNASNWKINSVSLSINTTRAKYITAFLETPCGTRIKLIARTSNLTNGSGFTNIIFTPSGTKIIGSTGNTNTPLTGSNYAADELSSWNANLLSCSNPNGTWKLIVGEYYNITTSGNPSISNWSIDFQTDTPNQIQSIAWSPTTNLSSIAYTGANTASGTATAKTSTAETLTLTVVDKGGCTTTKQVTVSTSGAPAPTCPGTNICSNTKATLTATGNPGATFKWYSDNTTTTPIAGSGTTGSYTTPNLTANTTYYVSQVSGGCESTRTAVTVTVGNSNTITLTSAVGTDAQTVCLNTPITNITYSTTSATGATFSGLPSGVTGVWNAGIVTISGTPSTATGSPFTYTITLTGGCGTVSKTGTITIISANTISLTSASGTDNQIKCINSPLTTITYATTGATGATITGLPSGVNGSWSSNVVTITGTPTTTTGSPFTYTITLTGGCGTASKTGTITVNPNQTLGLACGNTTSSSVQFTWSAITGATYSYSYLIDNSGSPITGTLTSGTSNYTINSLNPGQSVTFTLTPVGASCVTAETFTCTAVNCATPTVAAITSNSYCSGATIPAINFSSPDGGTSFNWNCSNTTIGLAASGTGNSIASFTAGNVTSTQTATISVTASNGGCVGPATTFTIIVNPINTITLSSPVGTDNQKICFNQSIQNITYQTTSASGATFNGLPTGVSGVWNSDLITISGTPSVSSNTPYSYTITLTGGCGTVTKTGTIAVNPIPTINAGNDVAICIGTNTKLNGSGGVSYVWDNGVTDNVSFSPTTTKTYTVIGTDANGCQSTDQIVVTVNQLPTPIASNSSPVCIGATSLTLNETSGQAVNWNWTTSSGATLSQNTIQSPSVSNPTNGDQFTVTITDVNGCQNSATTSITVNALPTFTPTAFSQCENDPLYVKANFSNPTSVVWSGPNGFSNSATSDNQVQVTASAIAATNNGTYSVDVTDQNNCTTTRTVTVSINTPPTVNAGNDFAICTGKSAILTATGAASSYSWDKNIINNSTFYPTTTDTYTVTGTDAFGCQNTDQITVTVNPLPDFLLTANTPCEQDKLDLTTDLSINPSTAGIQSYAWVGPNGFSSNIANPSVNPVTSAYSGNYILTITDNNNCINQESVNVTVIPVDNIQFADIDPTCVNGNQFKLPAVNILGGTWSSDDNTSIQDPNLGTFDPKKSVPDQDYKVVVTYSTKTIQPPRQCPSTKSKIVFVYPTPDTLYWIGDRELCITDTLKLKILNVDKNVEYRWDFNNGEFSTDTVVEYLYPQSGIFDLTLTSKLGMCVNTSTRKSYIEVIDIPTSADFTQSTNEIDFYNPEVQFLTNTNAQYYFWDFGDGTTSTYKNPKHIFPDKPGEYIIDLTVSSMLNKCGVTVTRSILMPEPVIYFIPNTFTPNGDEINNTFQPVFTYGYDAQNYSFYIYNRWGELMFESHDPKIGWDGTFGDNFVQNDTYIWKLEFKEKIKENKHVQTGHVNVMR